MIQMERFSVILLILCSVEILAGSTPTGSSATIETLLDNAHDVRDMKNHHVDLNQSAQNNTKYSLIDENSMNNTTQIGEHAMDRSHLNNASNATTTGNVSSSYITDKQHSEHNGDRKDDAHHKEGPSVGMTSHDILLDPGLIVRLSRQTKEGDADYSKPASIKNIYSGIKSNNHDESRSVVVPAKRSLSNEGDLSVAEDRYPPSYPYWDPYYRRYVLNQRYRANDRREPYRSYWRYPVFPGK